MGLAEFRHSLRLNYQLGENLWWEEDRPRPGCATLQGPELQKAEWHDSARLPSVGVWGLGKWLAKRCLEAVNRSMDCDGY